MQNIHRELRAAKNFNKLAAVLIITMLIVMGLMVKNLNYWADQYIALEARYEELYTNLVEEGEE